jgi:hypothetical protein
MNELDTYHECMVNLIQRRYERRKRVAETPWAAGRKARALAEIDEIEASFELEGCLLACYYGVWE